MNENENTGSFEMQRAEDGAEVRLAMQRLWLTGRLLPVGARLMVVHTFRSAEPAPLEVVYAFALPRDAALRRFQITGPGFRAQSELRPVAEARKAYEGAVEQGHLASLVRTYRDGQVNLSVGNVRPGEEVRVWLELVAGVEVRDEGFRFRFPFTLAPCYHREARMVEVEPGRGEMELPFEKFDDLLLPPWMTDDRKLHQVAFDLRVVWPGRPDEAGSPSHAIRVGEIAGGGLRVTSGRGTDVPNRDLVLDVRERGWTGGVFGGVADAKRRFATVVVPSRAFGRSEARPRSVVFLLDRSGSMGGEPLAQAKRGLRACLGALEPEDRFGIVAFDDAPVALAPGLQPATALARKQAGEFLDAIEVNGGTELAAGIKAAVGVLGREGGDVVVLTDGQVAETEAILRTVRAAGVRLHCLGIGSASQDRFLTLLARETGGCSRFVTPRERVDVEAVALFAGVGRPLAEGLEVRFPGAKGAQLVVEPPRHVHAGQPWIGMVEGPRAGRGGIELHWRTGSEARSWRVDWPAPTNDDAATVRLLQGARRITDLESRLEGEPAALPAPSPEAQRRRRELAALGRKYGLANRELALVAVVERVDDTAGGVPKTMVVPVGLPEDLRPAAYFATAQPTVFGRCSSASPRLAKLRSPFQIGSAMMNCCLIAKLPNLADGDESYSLAEPSPGQGAFAAVPLLNQAGELEADGGLPGADEEARAWRTAVFLAGLLEEGQACDRGLLRVLVRRVVAFLEDPAHAPAEAVARRVIETLIRHAKDDEPLRETHVMALATAKPSAGNWKKLAHALGLDVTSGA